MNREQTIGVVGASARAAVHSLLRAGYKAWAVDLFGDRDLALVALCAVCPLEEYPTALPRLAAQFPPGPVIYTGGLENHPQVVAELAASRELWGTPSDVLERVRDPYQLFPILTEAGFRVPAIVPRDEPCPTSGRWLRKSIRSGGGLGIRFASPGEPASPNHIFQEFIEGVPMSAVYGGTTLLDVSEQLVGEPWLHAKLFTYCGSIGPVKTLTGALGSQIRACQGIALPGLGNLDFILHNGQAVPVELNPRYSASIEVLEHAIGCSFVTLQLDPARRSDCSVVGKGIYYAPHTLTLPVTGPWDADLVTPFDPWRFPAFADIPAVGSVISKGQPVLTLLVSGSSPAECRARLQSRAGELDLLLTELTP